MGKPQLRKRSQPSRRLVALKIRLTASTVSRLRAIQDMQSLVSLSEAVRRSIVQGLSAMGV